MFLNIARHFKTIGYDSGLVAVIFSVNLTLRPPSRTTCNVSYVLKQLGSG